MKLILFLSEIKGGDPVVAQVGGKARNLARLVQAGFPVPRGFCLTADAYRYHLDANRLGAPIQSIQNDPVLSRDEKARQTRQMILGAPMPADLYAAVLEAWRSLTDGDACRPVAVRSSAVAEDTNLASFAGQYDTFLDVRGEPALVENIKRCWASLWAGRALDYQVRLQIDNPSAAMAVIVQQIVPAQCAGVVFTINPVTGADEIVIEVVPGLGDSLVSGAATPDHYEVDRRTWEIKISPQRQGCALLSMAQAQKLARLAVEVERQMGQPQDIEWAHSDGRIYLTQSRPVTASLPPDLLAADGQLDMAALLRRAREAGSQIWTDDNVGEVVPGVVTPLTWSVLEPMGNNAFRAFLRRVGVRGGPTSHLFGRFYGHVYFCQSQFQQLLTRFYPSDLGRVSAYPSRRPRLIRWGMALTAWLETGLRSVLLLLTLPPEAKRITRLIPMELKCAPSVMSMTGPELWAETERWRNIAAQTMSLHIAVTTFATLLYNLLNKWVSHWSDGIITAAHLVAESPGMKSADMGRDMQALAAEAMAEPGLRDCLLAAPADNLADCLGQLSPDSRFAQCLNEFLDKHGHASFQEFELAFPRWREDVGCVLSMLRGHLHIHADVPPVSNADAQQPTRLKTAAALRRQLRIGFRRLFFELALQWTRHYSVYRENVKYVFVMAYSHLRELYLAQATKLVARGTLDRVDDVFYLTRQELEALVTDRPVPQSFSLLVSRRLDEQRRYQLGHNAFPPII